ncbi:MAG: TolC family protein [Deltaproteobacteria bacterium]|jgi:outer membrane protein|nr:TolC family protein [Deltaproteobacteria bacterium]
MSLTRLALVLLLLFPAAALAAPEEYTLGRAVQTALERNFSVAAAQAGRQAAVSETNASRSVFGPVFKTAYGLERRQHDRSPMGQSQDRDLYAWSVSLTQNVFSGFADLSALQRASLAEESAEAGISKARIDLANLVQEHFFAYLRAKLEVISARDSKERLLSQLASSKAFYNVGVSPRLDVLQAEVDVSTAESALLVAENALETEKLRLNTLLVLPRDADVEYVGDFVFTPFTMSMDACLDRAYRSRPDLIIAEKAVEIAGKDARIIQSAFYPQINAQAIWSTAGDDWSVSGSPTRPARFNEWNIGLSAEWTFFEWGRTWFQAQQARHNQARIKAEADNLRQEIIFSVRERLLALREATLRIRVAKKAVEQATEAYRMADARYRSHVGTMTDVLDAQSKLSFAEASLAGAQADYSIALSRIFASMGLVNPTLEAL